MQVNLPNSVKRTDSELQAIMVAAVELNTDRGTGIIRVYNKGGLPSSIVTPGVEFVTGVGLELKPTTKMVYELTVHRTQEDMS